MGKKETPPKNCVQNSDTVMDKCAKESNKKKGKGMDKIMVNKRERRGGGLKEIKINK